MPKQTHTHTPKLVNTGKRGPPIVPLLFILEHFRNTSHMFCTRLANGGLFPTGDSIVPFVISPRFECLNKRTHLTYGTCGVLDCLLYCDQTRPNLRISLVGIVPLLQAPLSTPQPTAYVYTPYTWHLWGTLIVFSIVTKCGQTLEFLLWGIILFH